MAESLTEEERLSLAVLALELGVAMRLQVHAIDPAAEEESMERVAAMQKASTERILELRDELTAAMKAFGVVDAVEVVDL